MRAGAPSSRLAGLARGSRPPRRGSAKIETGGLLASVTRLHRTFSQYYRQAAQNHEMSSSATEKETSWVPADGQYWADIVEAEQQGNDPIPEILASWYSATGEEPPGAASRGAAQKRRRPRGRRPRGPKTPLPRSGPVCSEVEEHEAAGARSLAGRSEVAGALVAGAPTAKTSDAEPPAEVGAEPPADEPPAEADANADAGADAGANEPPAPTELPIGGEPAEIEPPAAAEWPIGGEPADAEQLVGGEPAEAKSPAGAEPTAGVGPTAAEEGAGHEGEGAEAPRTGPLGSAPRPRHPAFGLPEGSWDEFGPQLSDDEGPDGPWASDPLEPPAWWGSPREEGSDLMEERGTRWWAPIALPKDTSLIFSDPDLYAAICDFCRGLSNVEVDEKGRVVRTLCDSCRSAVSRHASSRCPGGSRACEGTRYVDEVGAVALLCRGCHRSEGGGRRERAKAGGRRRRAGRKRSAKV